MAEWDECEMRTVGEKQEYGTEKRGQETRTGNEGRKWEQQTEKPELKPGSQTKNRAWFQIVSVGWIVYYNTKKRKEKKKNVESGNENGNKPGLLDPRLSASFTQLLCMLTGRIGKAGDETTGRQEWNQSEKYKETRKRGIEGSEENENKRMKKKYKRDKQTKWGVMSIQFGIIHC